MLPNWSCSMWDFVHRLSSNYSTLPWGTGSTFLSPKDCMVQRCSTNSVQLYPAAPQTSAQRFECLRPHQPPAGSEHGNVVTRVISGRPENMPRKNGENEGSKNSKTAGFKRSCTMLIHVVPSFFWTNLAEFSPGWTKNTWGWMETHCSICLKGIMV